MRRELSPGDSAMERQGTLHTRISANKADPAAGDRGLACSGSTCSRQWNYPQGIALLEATGIHFTTLQARSLAGEQVAQPLDVLPGDFWRHRLALRLGWWRCWW